MHRAITNITRMRWSSDVTFICIEECNYVLRMHTIIPKDFCETSFQPYELARAATCLSTGFSCSADRVPHDLNSVSVSWSLSVVGYAISSCRSIQNRKWFEVFCAPPLTHCVQPSTITKKAVNDDDALPPEERPLKGS